MKFHLWKSTKKKVEKKRQKPIPFPILSPPNKPHIGLRPVKLSVLQKKKKKKEIQPRDHEERLHAVQTHKNKSDRRQVIRSEPASRISDRNLTITCKESCDKSIFRNLPMRAIRHVRRNQSRSLLVGIIIHFRESRRRKIRISILKHARDLFGSAIQRCLIIPRLFSIPASIIFGISFHFLLNSHPPPAIYKWPTISFNILSTISKKFRITLTLTLKFAKKKKNVIRCTGSIRKAIVLPNAKLFN